MKQYYKEVNLNNRAEMINFLKNHFRYHTMNSWNKSTSYANNVKIYNLGLTREQENQIYELLETEGGYDNINFLIEEFESDHDYKWQVGFNGRSGGYLVLYQGGRKDSGYKSICTNCGQLNYSTVEESGNNVCGKCREHTRINLTQPRYQTFSYPGRSTDMNEDFEEWTKSELKARVKLVQEFDQLCDNCLAALVNTIENYHVEEEEVLVPKTIKVLKEN